MCRTSQYLYSINAPLRLSVQALVLVPCLFVLVPLAAAEPSGFDGLTCRQALPLPLDRSIQGFATDTEPARYAVEISRPGLLLIEAHGVGMPPISPEVRFLDWSCRIRSGNLPLLAIRGRHVHRISSPGTYFLEVAADGLADGRFRLDAWFLSREEEHQAAFLLGGDLPTSEDPADGLPHEPMDEWDEMRLGGGLLPTASTWREVPGHGVLEFMLATSAQEVRFHSWCPWTRRPELLATFTCARQLLLDQTGTVELSGSVPGAAQLIGVRLASTGWLAFESTASSLSVALFDAQGGFVTELRHGDPVRLAAGRYFLKVEAAADAGSIQVEAELD